MNKFSNMSLATDITTCFSGRCRKKKWTGTYSCAQRKFFHNPLKENLPSVLTHEKRYLFSLISTLEYVKIIIKILVSLILFFFK